MYHLVENLRKIAILVKPFINDTAENILRQLGIENEDMKNWKNLKEYNLLEDIKVIEKGDPIFMRLKQDEEVEYIKNMMKR